MSGVGGERQDLVLALDKFQTHHEDAIYCPNREHGRLTAMVSATHLICGVCKANRPVDAELIAIALTVK